MKQCKGCGEPERRQTDASGQALLNLDPVTGLCIPCLVQQSKTTILKPMPAPFDAKQAQCPTNDD